MISMAQNYPISRVPLDEFRSVQDPYADQVFAALKSAGYNPLMNKDYNAYQLNSQDIPQSFPKVLVNYFTQLQKDAAQIDEQLINAGTRFFDRHASQLMATLGFLSLPYCYAAADGAKVLYASERIRKNPHQRLLETAQFVFDVCAQAAFSDEGKAVVSIGKVRLMHAAIRYYIRAKGDWNESWGAPINQEDMAGTNLAFSLIAIRGLRKLGYTITGESALDYILFWSEIGKLLGIEEALLPNSLKEAVILDKRISKRHFRYSQEGEALTKALKDSINHQSNFEAEGLMTYLLGESYSKLLGLNTLRVQQAIWSGTQGLIATSDLLSSYSRSNFKFAYSNFQKQASSDSLKPFRLLNNLND